jgi:hypothetical protein
MPPYGVVGTARAQASIGEAPLAAIAFPVAVTDYGIIA